MEQSVLRVIHHVPHVLTLLHVLLVLLEQLNCQPIYVVVMHHVLNVVAQPVQAALPALLQDYYTTIHVLQHVLPTTQRLVVFVN